MAEDGLAEVPLHRLLQPEAVADHERAVEAELVLDDGEPLRVAYVPSITSAGLPGTRAIVKKQRMLITSSVTSAPIVLPTTNRATGARPYRMDPCGPAAARPLRVRGPGRASGHGRVSTCGPVNR